MYIILFLCPDVSVLRTSGVIKYLVNIEYLVGEYLDHLQIVNMEKWGAPDNLIIYISQRTLSMLTFLKEIFCEVGAKNHDTTSLKKYSDFFFHRGGGGREKQREKNIEVWLFLTRLLLGTWPAT